MLLEVENAVWLRALALETLAALFALPHFTRLLFHHFFNKGIFFIANAYCHLFTLTLAHEENVFEQMIDRIGRFVKAQLVSESSAVFLPHPLPDVKSRW